MDASQAHSVAADASQQRVCIIGAGKAGLVACKVLHERGIPFDCFETGSQVSATSRGICLHHCSLSAWQCHPTNCNDNPGSAYLSISQSPLRHTFGLCM